MPSSEPRIPVRVSEEQKARWQWAAKYAGTSLSELIRTAVEIFLETHEPTLSVVTEQESTLERPPDGSEAVGTVTADRAGTSPAVAVFHPDLPPEGLSSVKLSAITLQPKGDQEQKATPPQEDSPATGPPTSCPKAHLHVKGRYCKWCKKARFL